MSPLTHTISRSDSIAPPAANPGSSPENAAPPGGIHRGSINGIPGGGVGAPLTSRSPVKESSYLARSASMDETGQEKTEQEGVEGSMSPPAQKSGIPIRR
jgi:hypothetical protein